MFFSVWVEITFEIETKIAAEIKFDKNKKFLYKQNNFWNLLFRTLWMGGIGHEHISLSIFFDNHPNDYRSWIVGWSSFFVRIRLIFHGATKKMPTFAILSVLSKCIIDKTMPQNVFSIYKIKQAQNLLKYSRHFSAKQFCRVIFISLKKTSIFRLPKNSDWRIR